MNKMMKKRGLLIIIVIILILTGIFIVYSLENRWIFSVNGEKLSDKDVRAFGFIYAQKYNIVDAQLLQKKYKGNQTYDNYYKEQFEEEILNTLLLYIQAKENKISLTKEEQVNVQKSAENLIEELGKDYLKKRGITSKRLERVYEMYSVSDVYLESMLEMDVNEGEDDDKNSQGDRYVKVYQVMFPTVELDENGMVQSESDGTLKQLSEEKRERKEAEASEFVQKVLEGEDMEALLRAYDNTVTGVERYMKYNDLDRDYKNAVDTLKEGEVSGVISSDYGYFVIKLLEKNAKTYQETLSAYEGDMAEQDKINQELEQLYHTYIKGNAAYKNEKRWKKIEIVQFVK